MLPGTWLTTPSYAPPFQKPLPPNGQFVDVYSEGGDGTIEFIVDSEMDQATGLAIGGSLGYLLGFGPVSADYARTLMVFFVQTQVYAFLILDSFTPPALNNEFPDVPPDIHESCGTDSIVGTNVSFSSCL